MPVTDNRQQNSGGGRSPVLSCRDLTIGYKGKAVLSGLNLDFEAGQFISLLGPNGAGKTTLLRTLSRHLDPLSGRIEIDGRALSRISSMELASVMAVVLTDKVSPPLFSVYEFVSLGRYPHTDFLGRLNGEDHEAVRHALCSVHADNLSTRTFTNLSDGERQKVLVARALAQQPRLLLLDEPTMHLDLKHRVEVMGILRDLCRSENITVIASLHDVDVAAKVSDRVALVKSGTISDYGPPETVLERNVVAGLYDFNGADFDYQLGSIELRGTGDSGRAFVLAGMGSGAVVYRMLAKRGYSIATGILHNNDLDYFIACSLDATCTVQEAMQPIDPALVAKAGEQINSCDAVIDCGFPIGSLNEASIELLQLALDKSKPIFSLRRAESGIPSSNGNGLHHFDNVNDLLDGLDSLRSHNGKAPQTNVQVAV